MNDIIANVILASIKNSVKDGQELNLDQILALAKLKESAEALAANDDFQKLVACFTDYIAIKDKEIEALHSKVSALSDDKYRLKYKLQSADELIKRLQKQIQDLENKECPGLFPTPGYPKLPRNIWLDDWMNILSKETKR